MINEPLVRETACLYLTFRWVMSFEDLLRALARASPAHVAIAIAVVILFRIVFVPRSSGATKRAEASDDEDETFPAPQPQGDLTKLALAAYDGSDATKPILLAAKGVIYDVTRGRDFYGKGAAYNGFAGRDCSRALGKVSLDEKDLCADVADFAASERDTLNGWVAKFLDKYPVVGVVTDGDYNGTF